MISGGKGIEIIIPKRERQKGRGRETERRAKCVVGRLRKDFLKEMAIQLKCEERTGFGLVEMQGARWTKGNCEKKFQRAECRAEVRDKKSPD